MFEELKELYVHILKFDSHIKSCESSPDEAIITIIDTDFFKEITYAFRPQDGYKHITKINPFDFLIACNFPDDGV